ncbi:zinc finger CCCH domain-containing protein 44 [Phtheirospermum japonicum]|uniref:Zinc finger CCCH domain-containing protein 44 n=1 Tax=Phtheirospermum japonicum TaxID=374723 RepID=A0A830B8P2_9LAMI|nr:zinc finger CCCH domain-containing protein 44 [Phtheirospermum japonicum]
MRLQAMSKILPLFLCAEGRIVFGKRKEMGLRCSLCRKSSHLHCYTCTKSVCRYCLSTLEILQVKGQYGFCKTCLKLALLIEEKRDHDSDGHKVDFTDRETFEGLHMEYYMIIKNEEGFELADIYAAKERVKAKKSHEAESGSEDFDEEEEEPISDYDDLEVQKKKRRRSQNRSNGRKPAKPTPTKSYKKEFIGWASRALIEFLGSIGKSTDEKLSQHEVTSIVNEYVKEKKLLNPEKKKFVMCDARLHSLFRKKTINKLRIHDLLEDHFAENHEESEDDNNVGPDSEEENLGTLNPFKRQRKTGVEKKSGKKDDVENNVPLKSRFASIVVENLKLVYLGRGVLKEMLKEAETFAEKVTGCFVRVKSDPYDLRSKSHQLVQVKGVKTVSVDENNTETVLLLSALPNEIRIPLVSDEGITEEEIEDLRKKVLSGEIDRPTVEYLQQKVNDVHKDMTNLHLERKKKLQSPTEQSRLLENVPTVIAEVYEPDRDSEGAKNDVKSDEGSPESINPCNSPVPNDGQQDDKEPEEENSRDGQISPSEKDQTVSVPKEPQQGPTSDCEPKQAKEKECEDLKIEVIAIPSDDE